MNEGKHTPGPWTVNELVSGYNMGNGWVILYGDAHRKRLDSRGEFERADAQLIAAAPELLECLKRDHESSCFGTTGYDGQPMRCLTCELIAKAEGRS